MNASTIAPSPLVFASPASVTRKVWEETNTAVKFRAWAGLFNNLTYIGRENVGGTTYYKFRATHACAAGVAKAGFNVYDLGEGVYGARRSFECQIVG